MIREIVIRETDGGDLWGSAAAGKCRTPEDARAVVLAAIANKPDFDGEKETFWVILLNTRNGVKAVNLVSTGILDSCLVHPREVYRPAIVIGAAAIICVHTHPSGDPAPSVEDIRITRQLIQAGKVIGINCLDHVVLGRPNTERTRDFVSMREAGLVEFE